MVAGADKMLDMMVENENSVMVYVAKEQFEGADKLTLIEKCDVHSGGGYYMMREYEGQEINRKMCLCQVTEFVFGDIPPQIFVKRQII